MRFEFHVFFLENYLFIYVYFYILFSVFLVSFDLCVLSSFLICSPLVLIDKTVAGEVHVHV
jgi:hypothetical protein